MALQKTENCPYELEDPILSLIGDTPLVEYPESLPGDVYCKLEKANPTGSHKDRLGLGMMLEMRRSGDLDEDDVVVEASSGNMAGGVALAANRLGHECVITTPESSSSQKMGYVRALGAELVECPPVSHEEEGYYQNEAKRIAEERGGVVINQYEKALNWQVHAKWTGPELRRQVEGTGVTHVICPMGSGGTLSGVGSVFKDADPSVDIIGVDAEHSNISRDFYDEEHLDYDTEIEGLGQYRTTPASSFEYIDEIVSVSDAEAIEQTRVAGLDSGLLIGMSSGATLAAAHDIAERDRDATVVMFVMDGANQYFDTICGDSSS